MIHAVLLVEIFLGCCGLLLKMGERQFETICHVYCNNSKHLPSGHHQCRGYVHMCVCVCVCACVCVFKILRQTIVEQSEVEIFTK